MASRVVGYGALENLEIELTNTRQPLAFKFFYFLLKFYVS